MLISDAHAGPVIYIISKLKHAYEEFWRYKFVMGETYMMHVTVIIHIKCGLVRRQAVHGDSIILVIRKLVFNFQLKLYQPHKLQQP